MKRIPSIAAMVSLGVVSLLQTGTGAAQDPMKVGTNVYKKVVFENQRVRICDIEFKPGEKIAQHSHPDHFAYVLEPGKLRISKPDGTSSEVDFQKGQVAWIPAETHWAENIGSTPLKALIVELKEPAAKAPAMKK